MKQTDDLWLNHPAMESLDPVKRELIRNAAGRVRGKSGNHMAMAMMSMLTGARKRGITFSSEETDLILSVLKEGKSDEEIRQIDHMIQMVKELSRNAKKKTGR